MELRVPSLGLLPQSSTLPPSPSGKKCGIETNLDRASALALSRRKGRDDANADTLSRLDSTPHFVPEEEGGSVEDRGNGPKDGTRSSIVRIYILVLEINYYCVHCYQM